MSDLQKRYDGIYAELSTRQNDWELRHILLDLLKEAGEERVDVSPNPIVQILIPCHILVLGQEYQIEHKKYPWLGGINVDVEKVWIWANYKEVDVDENRIEDKSNLPDHVFKYLYKEGLIFKSADRENKYWEGYPSLQLAEAALGLRLWSLRNQ